LRASTCEWRHPRDLDRILLTETRPDGVSILRTPDSAGRLDTVAIPGGLIDYDYVLGIRQDHLEEAAAPRVEAMGRPLDELSNY
jgi:hypothetical protein